MIDIEPQVYTRVAAAVRAKFPGVYVTGEYVSAPDKFPCVSLEESDNQVFRSTRSSDFTENHASLMYTLRVFSNLKKGRKSECREIAAVADAEMEKMGFTRRTLIPVRNLNDATIYQMVGRYSAIVSKNEVIYRR